MNPEIEEKLRMGFKYFNQFMLSLWRLGLGPLVNWWPDVGGRIMVITHTGRKSGLRRQTPVNYALIGEDVYCVAGFGRVSDWYRNILTNPQVEIWLPDSWWAGTAVDVSDEDGRLGKVRTVLIASGFAARAAGINPHTMSDQDLAEAVKEYRLVRIRREQAHTGPGGPGELAWVWPVATFILLPLVLFRPRRK